MKVFTIGVGLKPRMFLALVLSIGPLMTEGYKAGAFLIYYIGLSGLPDDCTSSSNNYSIVMVSSNAIL